MLKLKRILHAGYIFESGGARILVDPLFENPFSVTCHAFPPITFDIRAIAREHYDAIFISHYHDDHCSFESLHLLDRSIPIYMFCIHSEMFDLLSELGFKNVHSLELGKTVRIASTSQNDYLEVTAWLSLDRDVDCLLQITDGESQILNVVDSWIDYDTVEKLAKISWDLILWPFQTMLELDILSPSRAQPASREIPPEWIEQLRELKPRAVIPSSCQFNFGKGAWQNLRYFPISYASFAKTISEELPSTAVIRLDPGAELELHDPENARIANAPIYESDYAYDMKSRVPALKEEVDRDEREYRNQKFEVQNFIECNLPEIFASLDASAEPFFEKPRIWNLRLYAPQESPIDCYFKINGQSLTRLPPGTNSNRTIEQTEWLTEIPVAKLYAATHDGESLTSLMIRINDQKFSAATERELADCDFLADPLLRTLYENKFASYQKAQLARIKKKST